MPYQLPQHAGGKPNAFDVLLAAARARRGLVRLPAADTSPLPRAPLASPLAPGASLAPGIALCVAISTVCVCAGILMPIVVAVGADANCPSMSAAIAAKPNSSETQEPILSVYQWNRQGPWCKRFCAYIKDPSACQRTDPSMHVRSHHDYPPYCLLLQACAAQKL
jgi:hypothetical protein